MDPSGGYTMLLVGQQVTQLQNAAQEAKDLRRLVGTAHAPMVGVDGDGRISEWNRGAADITGYSAAEAMGRELVGNFVPHQHQEAVRSALQQARTLPSSQTCVMELKLQTKLKQHAHLVLSCISTGHGDDDGGGRVLGLGQNVTRRNSITEEEMQRMGPGCESSHELHLFIDSANAPIFGIDTQGNVNEWNHMLAEMTGYGKAEATGRNLVSDFISPPFKENVHSVLQLALKGQGTVYLEFQLCTKEGAYVDVLLNATTRRDVGGNITGVVGVGQDITERNAAQVELERVAEEMLTLINIVNAPIFGIDQVP